MTTNTGRGLDRNRSPTMNVPTERDGLACVVCNANYLTTDVPYVPVGTSPAGSQVFASSACTEPAAARKSGTWPDGEPEEVGAADASPAEIMNRVLCATTRIEKRHGSSAAVTSVRVLIAAIDGFIDEQEAVHLLHAISRHGDWEPAATRIAEVGFIRHER